MPTRLNDFNSVQDALTVFLDYRKEKTSDSMRNILKERFKPMQALYLYGEKCEEDGANLYQCLQSKIEAGEVVLPKSERFVFCHYLPLNNLTEEWVQSWEKRVSEFQERLNVEELFQQYHVVCLIYESSKTPLGEKKEETARLIKQLATGLLDIAHVVYLLYTNGFETLAGQEQGIVQLLYILSRKNTASMIEPMQQRTWLKMLTYSDYSRQMAEMWSGKIQLLTHWMTEEADPQNRLFVKTIEEQLTGPAGYLHEAEINFDSRVDIYPVHISDFEKSGFLWNKTMSSRIGADHEIIRRRKKEYFGTLLEKMILEFDYTKVEDMVIQKLCYKDMQKLPAFINGSLQAVIEEDLLLGREERARESIRQLIQGVCVQIQKKLSKYLESADKIRSEKQKEMQEAQRALNIAGRYRNMDECFQNIAKESEFKPMNGRFPSFLKDICLVGSECYGKWGSGLTIEGVSDAYFCTDIDPMDVVFLKTGDLIQLDKEEEVQKLVNIL